MKVKHTRQKCSKISIFPGGLSLMKSYCAIFLNETLVKGIRVICEKK